MSVLHESATMELIGAFGFHTSKDTDKFSELKTALSDDGITYVAEQVCAHFSVRVNQQLDLGTHILFVGDVLSSEIVETTEPMTYAYYHQVKGGRTPAKASGFSTHELEEDASQATHDAKEATADTPAGSKRVAWRCTICGYIEYVDELPDDFTCPICGAGKEFFERIEVEA